MFNKIFLIGRLGADPTVKYTQEGTTITNFNIATDEKWNDKNGEKVQKTEWHKITAFGKLAEICGKYLKRGSQIFLEGKVQTRNYDDKDGVKRYVTEVIAKEMLMLDKKTSGDDGSAGDDSPF